MVTRYLSCLPLLTLAACGIDLPEEALLEGPRVLAVRVVPSNADEARPDAALVPGAAASVEALVVDELGPIDPGLMSALWVACPLGVGLPAFSCLEESLPVERDALPSCPETVDASAPLPAPCVLAETLEPDFTVPGFEQALAGARLELTLVLALERHDDVDRCADALFRGDYDTPEGCVYTSYALSLATPSEPANRHPGPGTITATIGDRNPVELPAGTVFPVPSGELVTLMYEPTDEDTESYEVPVNNGASFETILEDPTVRWFRTGGEFLSDAPFALFSEIELDLPDESTRVYAVLRDGRGGVGWWWADLVPE
jgi:hypothetical protein